MRRTGVAVLVLAASLAEAALAQRLPTPQPPWPERTPPPPSQRPVITNPEWLTRPNPADFYPAGALAKGLTGRVVMRCVVDDDGALHGCVVVSEIPANMQFGTAAMRMAPKFRLANPSRMGVRLYGYSVTVPIVFDPKLASKREVSADPSRDAGAALAWPPYAVLANGRASEARSSMVRAGRS